MARIKPISKPVKYGVPAIAIVAIAAFALFTSNAPSGAAVTVPLGNSSNFAVLAGSGITNTGATTVSGTAGGDMGSAPTPAFTGEGSVTVTNGTKYLAAEAIVVGAKTALDTAYLDAAGRTSTASISADLGGQTLVGGVYTGASSIGLTGTLILDGADDPNSVWIFQAGSTLTTASASSVSLIRGAQPCNVFWQIGSSTVIGTGSQFVGHVLAQTSITDNGGSTIQGQLLARDAAVTLNNTTIINNACDTATPTPTPTPTATATATPPPSGGGDTSTPTPTPTVTPSPSPEASTIAGGELPNTETPWVNFAVLGAFLVVIGGLVLLQRRKRN